LPASKERSGISHKKESSMKRRIILILMLVGVVALGFS
jgi:hypothetical protein